MVCNGVPSHRFFVVNFILCFTVVVPDLERPKLGLGRFFNIFGYVSQENVLYNVIIIVEM